MQKDSWLKTAEYTALFGSAIGTVAATLSSQVTYAAVPLTLALSLNLVNRNRLEQRTRRYTTAEIAQVHQLVDSLHNQVTALPSQAIDLKPIYQAISQLDNDAQRLVKHYNARPEITQIQELREAIAALPDPLELKKLLYNVQILVQHYIARPELKQIQELKEAIASYPLELNELQHKTQKLTQQFNARPEIEQIQELRKLISSLPNPTELNELQNDVQKLAQLFNSRSEIEQIQELREAISAKPNPLELNELRHQTQSLVQQFNTRPEIEQIQALTEAIAGLPNPLELEEVKQEIATQVDESIRNFVEQIKAQLALIEPYDYDLVFDRPESRATLMQALKQAQHRLILVCPWISYGTDERVVPKLEKLLQRNVCIDIGWGSMKDINAPNNSSIPTRQKLRNSGHYDNLPQLEALEHKYPQQFKLKLLGTHEKFLVCDHSWAMFGSHNFLTSNASSLERELGLKTNDPRIVAKLIERFDSAKDLEKEDRKKKIIG